MIQKMMNKVPINIADIDMTTVSDIVVSIQQASTNTSATFSDFSVEVVSAGQIEVTLPKSFCMGLAATYVNVQVAFTHDGVPDATDVFKIPVRELQLEEGYGS